jgi:hypothetical protein
MGTASVGLQEAAPFDCDEICLLSTNPSLPSICADVGTRLRWALVCICLAMSAQAAVEQTPFDLVGPKVSIQVKREAATRCRSPTCLSSRHMTDSKSSPAWRKPKRPTIDGRGLPARTDRPATGSAWFFRCDTWKSPCDQAGLERSKYPKARSR